VGNLEEFDAAKISQVLASYVEPLPLFNVFNVSACIGMTTKKVWSYTLMELKGMTKVTVQPVWEYPDDYCKTQTQELNMEPARGDCSVSNDARQSSRFECAEADSESCSSLPSSCSRFQSRVGRKSAVEHEATHGFSGIGKGQPQHYLQVRSEDFNRWQTREPAAYSQQALLIPTPPSSPLSASPTLHAGTLRSSCGLMPTWQYRVTSLSIRFVIV
jgi:hypothetical protein